MKLRTQTVTIRESPKTKNANAYVKPITNQPSQFPVIKGEKIDTIMWLTQRAGARAIPKDIEARKYIRSTANK
jgi:hypothetical protein